jgi:hypothetical protein
MREEKLTGSSMPPGPFFKEKKKSPAFPVTPEIEFALLSSIRNPNERQRTRMVVLSGSNLNWNTVYRFSIEHRIFPLTYTHIAANLSLKAPRWLIESLRNDYISNARRNLHLTSVLLFCLSLFKRNNITVVPFKGPLLGQHVYGDIGLRPFSDLDLFVKTGEARCRHKHVALEAVL